MPDNFWDQFNPDNPDQQVGGTWAGAPQDTDPVYGNQVNTGILNPTGPLASPTSNPNYVSPAQSAAGYMPPAVTGPGSAPGDPVAFIRQWQATHPASANAPAEIVAALRANGFNASPFMYGSTPSGNEINLNGEKFKVIGGENSGSPSWYRGEYDGPGPGGGFSLQGLSGVAPFQAPGLLTPYANELTMPSQADLENDPGYQFRLGQGMQGIKRDAAVKGTLKSGGTLKDLTAFGQGLASDEYNNLFNRNLALAGFNRGSLWGNEQNAYNMLSGLSGQGLGAASQYATNGGNLFTNQGNANAYGTVVNAQNTGGIINTLGNLGQDIYQSYANRPRTNASAQRFNTMNPTN